MVETKLGKAFEGYMENQIGLIKWIIGLSLGEVVFVISQSYYNIN